jgi:hypothetical protein
MAGRGLYFWIWDSTSSCAVSFRPLLSIRSSEGSCPTLQARRKGYPQSSALRYVPFVQTKGLSTPASRSAGSD